MKAPQRQPPPTGVHALTGPRIESWRLLWEEMARDEDAMAAYGKWQARRQQGQPEMLELLRRFLAGTIATEELRATFDRRAKGEWDVFGLNGMSGAMFLNRLVKHGPDPRALTSALRRALPAPEDAKEAGERLDEFVSFLRDLRTRAQVEARQIQPARAAFFVSAWWHVQDTERWPAFQPSARQVLRAEEDLYTPSGDPVRDYLAFREMFLAVSAALKRTTWELEYLCWWHLHRESAAYEDMAVEVADESDTSPRRDIPRERMARVPVVREPRADPHVEEAQETSAHTHIQWLLAKIGRKLGCRVWIAANDRNRRWKGESLTALSISRLPSLGIDPESQRIVSLIDVVWLGRTNQVTAAFEVEHTTSVYSGLLRMADLAALAPNLNFPLYLVAPEDRLEKVRRELLRPTFQMLELHRRCAFFSSEALLNAAESIMRWGSGPAAIDRLAARVDDVRTE